MKGVKTSGGKDDVEEIMGIKPSGPHRFHNDLNNACKLMNAIERNKSDKIRINSKP
ncbi:hypothetical protein [Pedobacter sp. KBW06]|uniref:hypothetical protein n=1 Tax=Pedobacter sp. KBW06 TaxID=2153359 RepID=UPI0013153277|nr:hypothetical protein [Pedobacter sp. KBW06]